MLHHKHHGGGPILQICSLWSPDMTTATRFWMDSLPPRANLRSISRTLILWPPLAPCSSSHQIQDNGTGLQGGQRNCPCIPPSIGRTTQPSPSAPFNNLSLTPCTTIAKSKRRSHNKDTTLLFWHWWCNGVTNYLLMSGPQSHSPGSARDSRLTWSEFTKTLHSLPPYHHLPLHSEKYPFYALIIVCTSRHLMYAVIECLYILAQKNSTGT